MVDVAETAVKGDAEYCLMPVTRVGQYSMRLCQALPDEVFGERGVANLKQLVQVAYRDIERGGNFGRVQI